MSVEALLARHVHHLMLDDISTDALAALDRLLLDFVAVIVAGRSDLTGVYGLHALHAASQGDPQDVLADSRRADVRRLRARKRRPDGA